MSETKITIKKRIFNDIYYKYLRTFNPTEVFMGGASAGKSHFVAQRFVYRMMLWPCYNVLVIRKVSAANHSSTFALMKQIIYKWDLASIFKINDTKGDESITCRNGSQMLFKGLKDDKEREKIKSITFQTGVVNHIWVEEASEITEADLTHLNIRLRGISKYKKQVTLSFNPIRKTHWLKKVFFDKKQPNTLVLKTTYKDNAFLTQSDKDYLENLKNTDLLNYKIYALAEWGELGQTVFNKYRIEKIEYPDYEIEGIRYKLTSDDYYDRIVQGMDFGYEHPSVFERIGFKDGKPFWFSEQCETHMTNEEWINHLEKHYEAQGCLEQVKRKKTIADSAEPDRIKEFRNRGWNVHPSKKGKGSIHYGVDWLRKQDMIIDEPCTRIYDEIQVFRNKIDRDGKLVDQQYVEDFNDAIAACLTGDTIINTLKGDIKIKDLVNKAGLVKTWDGKNEIAATYHGVRMTKRYQPIYKIKLSDGGIIRGTKEHPILTKRGWIRIKDLTNMDEVVKIDN